MTVWTDPRTWVTSEVVDETIMNAHIRDNEDATLHRVAYMDILAQMTISGTDVLADVTDMSVAVEANEVWYMNFLIVFSSQSTTPDLKLAFTWPSGTAVISTVWPNSAGTITTQTFTSSGTGLDFQGTTTIHPMPLEGIFRIGGTGGDVKVQAAQNLSDAASTTIRRDSHINACRLA